MRLIFAQRRPIAMQQAGIVQLLPRILRAEIAFLLSTSAL